MKMTLQEFHNALSVFATEVAQSFNEQHSFQKFLLGAALEAKRPEIDAWLGQYMADGLVDVDRLRAIVNSGMKFSGGEFEMPFNFGVFTQMGILPLNTRIIKSDVDKFFDQTIPSMASAGR